MNWLPLFYRVLPGRRWIRTSYAPRQRAPMPGVGWFPPSVLTHAHETVAMREAAANGKLWTLHGTAVWREDALWFVPDSASGDRPLEFVALPGRCVALMDASGTIVHCESPALDDTVSTEQRDLYNANLLTLLGRTPHDLEQLRHGAIPPGLITRGILKNSLTVLLGILLFVVGLSCTIEPCNDRHGEPSKIGYFVLAFALLLVIGGLARHNAFQRDRRVPTPLVEDRPLSFRYGSEDRHLPSWEIHLGNGLGESISHSKRIGQTIPGAVHRFYILPESRYLLAIELAPGPLRRG